MKYIRQFSIILIVSFLGELLKSFIPLPIPASIYGLVLMLAALWSGIVPLEAVRETGKFLISIMQLMFIPAAAGLLVSWKEMQDMLIPFIVIIIVSTGVVFGISGRVTQAVMKHQKHQKNQKQELL